jgi:hypothetical protein
MRGPRTDASTPDCEARNDARCVVPAAGGSAVIVLSSPRSSWSAVVLRVDGPNGSMAETADDIYAGYSSGTP